VSPKYHITLPFIGCASQEPQRGAVTAIEKRLPGVEAFEGALYKETRTMVVQSQELKELHPLATTFPEASEEDERLLAESLKRVGFRRDKPIILLDGMILDGRNRYNVARKLGISAIFAEYDSPLDPTEYVLTENRDRRHLTSGQKAAIAVKLGLYKQEQEAAKKRVEDGKKVEPQDKGEVGRDGLPHDASSAPEDRAHDGASGKAAEKVGGTSGRQVRRAAYLETHFPQEFEAVRRDEVSLTQAYEAARAADKYPVLAGIMRPDRIKMAKTLDAYGEEERKVLLDGVKEEDQNTLAFLSGKPPMPEPKTKEDEARKKTAERWYKAMRDLVRLTASVDEGEALRSFMASWDEKAKDAYLKEVRDLKMTLSSWEEMLERAIGE
jgi:hypothetical protein